MRVTAIIPAKSESRRIERKNMQPFGGSTLVGHKVTQLLACDLIDDVVVGSDSDEILNHVAHLGADVRKRDAHHCDEAGVPLQDRLRNLAAMVDTDVVVWAHCTNPLCTPDIYDNAVRSFLDFRGTTYDSLCSVSRVQRHAWRADREPSNFNPWGDRHQLAAELDPLWFQNGAIFIQPHQQMLENRYFYGKHPSLFEIDQPYDLDIDEPHDLYVARAIYDAMRREVTA